MENPIVFIDIQGHRERVAAVRQNLTLGLMEGHTPDEQVRIACQAGVSDPLELAALLGRPLEERDRRIMFATLLWQPNSVNHPLFEQEYRAWRQAQKWE